MLKIIKCKGCGKEFKGYVYPNREIFYCSKKCYIKNKIPYNKGIHKKLLNRVCINCKKKYKTYIHTNKKFCSWKCYKEWQGKGLDATYNICIVCSKKYKTKPCWLKKHTTKYCSRKCKYVDMKEKYSLSNNPNWQNGKSFEPYSPEFNGELKEKIRKRDKYACQRCGKTEKELKGMHKHLDVHHRNFNKKDNRIGNLISYCKRCHSIINRKNLNRKETF